MKYISNSRYFIDNYFACNIAKAKQNGARAVNINYKIVK